MNTGLTELQEKILQGVKAALRNRYPKDSFAIVPEGSKYYFFKKPTLKDVNEIQRALAVEMDRYMNEARVSGQEVTQASVGIMSDLIYRNTMVRTTFLCYVDLDEIDENTVPEDLLNNKIPTDDLPGEVAAVIAARFMQTEIEPEDVEEF